MRTQTLQIPNRNGLNLSAQMDLPLKERPRAYAIFAHCFTCGKNLRAEKTISLSLTQSGFAVIRFDFAGVGESEGEFYETNFSTQIADILDVANFLSTHYEAPQLLVGHSLGGAGVLLASEQLPSVRAVATIGAPSNPEHVKHLFGSMQALIEQEGEAQVLIAGRPFVIQRHFLRDLESHDVAATLTKLKKSLLIVHSPQDQIVGIDNARKIYEMARHPKSFLSLDGGDHLMGRKADAEYVGSVVAAWSSRYLELADSDPVLTDQQAVARIGKTGYTTEIRMGSHTLWADEPKSVGGDDLGPSPYDLLLAALGACTGMTLRMYADRKKWPLEEVVVHLNHEKRYPEDMALSEERPQKLDHIFKRLEFLGDLSDEQRARLKEIAERCPVNRTLNQPVVIDSELGGDQEG
ncbi:bifunctional alpha/beta hydrolase/OsmC family protein [Pontibacter sp. G13]|uniref:bifunctional alpha/beta hydrolase/OsmC family protein n=1 Tax=Pontibacter sp. G13 TaxID=3074898 RepID=UPI00288A8E81|nr:bifunctional alpha/beta hydrolase/OsmC family protein [Pontibacter sp. G13]WNJ19411.1 bifunctional alpha/beta hydrolase/OsmC family protein [Pontibacter sp. G13]